MTASIVDCALADLRAAAGATGRITTRARGITRTWPLGDAEQAIRTAAGFSWRDDRTAISVETAAGDYRIFLLTPTDRPSAAESEDR